MNSGNVVKSLLLQNPAQTHSATFEHAQQRNNGSFSHAPSQCNGHDHLLERGIACTLADAVDGALHLSSPIHRPGQTVGCGQPEVILTVCGDDHTVCSRRVGFDVCDEAAKLVRKVPARGVGDVEGGGASLVVM